MGLRVDYCSLLLCAAFSLGQKTSSMATVELCAGSTLGSGFQLMIGLAEIHVPRMWVEEDDKGHHVREWVHGCYMVHLVPVISEGSGT